MWELLSYVVTVIGLPVAKFTFWREQRKERENEDEETYQLLSDAYADFLKLVMANPDLQLRSRPAAPAAQPANGGKFASDDIGSCVGASRTAAPVRLTATLDFAQLISST